MKAKLINRGNGNYRLYIDEIPYATTDNSPYKKLSKQNCDEIFGVVDVVDLAERNSKYSEEDYIEGFNKAMELNKDKLFTADDMINFSSWRGKQSHLDNHYIPSDQLKLWFDSFDTAEIDVMIVNDGFADDEGIYCGNKPKLDSEGCLILKRVV
jgi:hypothetical protein